MSFSFTDGDYTESVGRRIIHVYPNGGRSANKIRASYCELVDARNNEAAQGDAYQAWKEFSIGILLLPVGHLAGAGMQALGRAAATSNGAAYGYRALAAGNAGLGVYGAKEGFSGAMQRYAVGDNYGGTISSIAGATSLAGGLYSGVNSVGPIRSPFIQMMEESEARRYKAYWSEEVGGATRYRWQVAPGYQCINDWKLSGRSGKPYMRQVIYDRFGKVIGVNDYGDHGQPAVHPNPHYHELDFSQNWHGPVTNGLYPFTPGGGLSIPQPASMPGWATALMSGVAGLFH